jgi:hypothetical protein
MPYFFPHLAAAAFWAISLRRLAESAFARAGPPFFPIADAASLIFLLSFLGVAIRISITA